MKPARRLPAICLNCSSLREAGVGGRGSGVGAGAGSGATMTTGSGAGAGTCSDSRLAAPDPRPVAFAFFRIFARSTMDVAFYRCYGIAEAMLARGGGDPRGVDGAGVVAEGIEQRGCSESVEQTRDSPADVIHGADGFASEGAARPAGDADAVLDITLRLLER